MARIYRQRLVRGGGTHHRHRHEGAALPQLHQGDGGGWRLLHGVKFVNILHTLVCKYWDGVTVRRHRVCKVCAIQYQHV